MLIKGSSGVRKKTHKLSFKGFIIRSFIAGLSVLVPFFLTFYILDLVVTSFDRITHWLPQAWRPEQLLFPGAGLVIVFIVATAVGIVVRNYFGRLLLNVANDLVERIPFVAPLYNVLRQVSQTILGEDAKKSFRRVVMVEWPRREAWTIAFVTSEDQGVTANGLQKKRPGTYLSLFMPTTPNPTSGFYFVVHADDVVDLDITVEQAFKTIVSTGTIGPDAPVDAK